MDRRESVGSVALLAHPQAIHGKVLEPSAPLAGVLVATVEHLKGHASVTLAHNNKRSVHIAITVSPMSTRIVGGSSPAPRGQFHVGSGHPDLQGSDFWPDRRSGQQVQPFRRAVAKPLV